jgi:hypothetical protein
MCDYEIFKSQSCTMEQAHYKNVDWMVFLILLVDMYILIMFWIEYFGTNSHCCVKKSPKSDIKLFFFFSRVLQF